MPEKLKNIFSLVDEREEVIFWVIFIVLTALVVAPLFDKPLIITGTEFIAGLVTLYTVLIAGKAVKGRKNE